METIDYTGLETFNCDDYEIERTQIELYHALCDFMIILGKCPIGKRGKIFREIVGLDNEINERLFTSYQICDCLKNFNGSFQNGTNTTMNQIQIEKLPEKAYKTFGLMKRINDLICQKQKELDAIIEENAKIFEGSDQSNYYDCVANVRRINKKRLKVRYRYFTLGMQTKNDFLNSAKESALSGIESKQYAIGCYYDMGIIVGTDEKEAVKWYKRAAEKGYAKAQFLLACCYEIGKGMDQNIDEAVKWHTNAANFKKNSDSQYNLAMLYKYGRGVENNDEKYRELICASAEQGNALAEYISGLEYETKGFENDEDNKEALILFRKSAEHGNARAQAELASMLEDDGNQSEAQKWYEKSSDQNYAEGQCGLAMCYLNKNVSIFNPQKGLQLLKISAAQGYSIAQFFLAWYGPSFDEDFKDSLKWLLKSARQGNYVAQYFLAQKYATGDGVELNIAEAKNWYTESATLGYADAQYELGKYYLFGDSANTDFQKAVEWLRKAAEQENQMALYALGNCYFWGCGVKKDEGQAIELYQKAAQLKYNPAEFALGNCYSMGIGVEADLEQAFLYYKRAADQKNKEAEFAVGCCYFLGKGINADYKEALKWMRSSAEALNPNAQCILGYCYFNGLGTAPDKQESLKWYRKSIQNKDSVGLFAVQDNYLGLTEDKDLLLEICEWYQKSAKRVFEISQFAVQYQYYLGQNLEKKWVEIKDSFTKLFHTNQNVTQYTVGTYFETVMIGGLMGKEVIEKFIKQSSEL